MVNNEKIVFTALSSAKSVGYLFYEIWGAKNTWRVWTGIQTIGRRSSVCAKAGEWISALISVSRYCRWVKRGHLVFEAGMGWSSREGWAQLFGAVGGHRFLSGCDSRRTSRTVQHFSFSGTLVAELWEIWSAFAIFAGSSYWSPLLHCQDQRG